MKVFNLTPHPINIGEVELPCNPIYPSLIAGIKSEAEIGRELTLSRSSPKRLLMRLKNRRKEVRK